MRHLQRLNWAADMKPFCCLPTAVRCSNSTTLKVRTAAVSVDSGKDRDGPPVAVARITLLEQHSQGVFVTMGASCCTTCRPTLTGRFAGSARLLSQDTELICDCCICMHLPLRGAWRSSAQRIIQRQVQAQVAVLLECAMCQWQQPNG